MEYTLTKGNQSNYEIQLTIVAEELETYKQKALESFQKEMKEPGFRPGHVPLNIVEQKVKPEYIEVAMYEEVLHGGTKKILEEHADIKFIGNIYDLNKEEKDDKINFTFKIDVYPEVEVTDEKWKKLTVNEVSPEATDEEINETLHNLKKQYANYHPADKVEPGTLFKISCSYLDKDDQEIDKKSVFVGQEEWDASDNVEGIFNGKAVNEEIKVDYVEKNLPEQLYVTDEEKKKSVITLVCTIKDIRKVELPEFTPETIKKLFGNEDVKDETELREKIGGLIASQKEEAQLMQSVDDMLQDAKKHLRITIPKTLVDEELKTRMKSLTERMGGEQGLKDYFEKIGEEQSTKMQEDIKTAAQTSLEKFFMLQKLTELFEIKDIDWNTSLDVEKKIYETLRTKE